MDTLDEDKIRIQAEQARQILANPLFDRYIDQQLKNIILAWRREPDRDKRETLWITQAAIQEFTNGLRQYIYTAQQIQSEDENE